MTTDTATSSLPRSFLSRRLGWVLLAGIGAVTWAARHEWRSETHLAACGEAALAAHDLPQAERWAERLLRARSDSGQGLWLKGQIAERQGRVRAAIAFYGQIPPIEKRLFVGAHLRAGELAFSSLQHYSLAESHFARAAGHGEVPAAAHQSLAYLLGLQSRSWEAMPHRLIHIRNAVATASDLYLLVLGDRALDDPAIIMDYLRRNPDDAGAKLACGRLLAEQGERAKAIELLRSAAASPPHAAEAYSRWGALLVDQATPQYRSEWQIATRSMTDHPGVWQARGLLAEADGDSVTAAKCFLEAARLDPGRAIVFYRLGQILVRHDREAEAAPLLEHARRLEELAKSAELVFRVGEAQHLRRVIAAAEACGFLTEAWGWARLLHEEYPDSQTAPLVARLHASLPRPDVRADVRLNPARAIALDDLVEPATARSPAASGVETSSRVPLAFAAEPVDFRYDNGGDPARGLVHMYEITGGGVAVLDFDLDLWPDLYFPQGGTWAIGESRSQTDQLFQNASAGRLVNVTAHARVVEAGFSQGATVGDIDDDGFPDLFIANAGRNRLFHNQGDGTFVEVTQLSGLNDADYSVSAVLADLSGDGFADLYVVNYLAGDDLWTRVCGGADGVQRSCLPQSFPAATDRFWLSLGDGRFADESKRSGVASLAGKGLGVIAADFAQRRRLDLYIANDAGPNFLLERSESRDTGLPQFQDIGLPTGVALDGAGRTLSSMGVSAGDADGDGLLDLVVTNFELEPSSYYRQVAPLQFVDATRTHGLVDAPLNLVGWGTQWFDADLDGWLDLAITNGHVNNLTDHGKSYRMPTRLFRNLGGGQMDLTGEWAPDDYFSQPVLGRGMARWDGDRDGREDLVLTHLDRPPAVLWNRTSAPHHGVGLVLTAVGSQRDAIGATVTVTTGQGEIVRQLTAGDGNQSTNQRRLVFGLGPLDRIQGVAIQWPSGTQQASGPLVVDAEYRWIEGRPPYRLFDWRRDVTPRE